MTELIPCLVVLNPASRGGKGRERYERVRSAVEARFDPELVETDVDGRWRTTVHVALSRGVRAFVAAGGDGTVGAVVSAVVSDRGGVPLDECILGAVGLGSSNDFHKPVRTVVGGIPVRLDVSATGLRDIAVAEMDGRDGQASEKLFVVSASMGLVAEANALFNSPGRSMPVLRRAATGVAIGCAALATVVRYRNREICIRYGNEKPRTVELSNLSVMKTPYLSGSFRYDTPVSGDDGLLAVNVCAGMSRRRLVRTMAALLRGRFQGLPGTSSRLVATLAIAAPSPTILELDGEIVSASDVRFRVLPERIAVCG